MYGSGTRDVGIENYVMSDIEYVIVIGKGVYM